MNTHFNTDARILPPELAHGRRCACLLHARRRLGGALLGGVALAAWPTAQAQPETSIAEECKVSGFTKVVSA